jgi:hypothetical protein
MLQKLKDLMKRQPFEPFKVVMSSGPAYDVRHPEFALLVQGGLYVGVPVAENGAVETPQDAVYCSMLHIAALEPLPVKRRKKH